MVYRRQKCQVKLSGGLCPFFFFSLFTLIISDICISDDRLFEYNFGIDPKRKRKNKNRRKKKRESKAKVSFFFIFDISFVEPYNCSEHNYQIVSISFESLKRYLSFHFTFKNISFVILFEWKVFQKKRKMARREREQKNQQNKYKLKDAFHWCLSKATKTAPKHNAKHTEYILKKKTTNIQFMHRLFDVFHSSHREKLNRKRKKTIFAQLKCIEMAGEQTSFCCTR